MENFVIELKELIVLIDWVYMLIFVLFSYGIKKTFGGLLQRITKFKWDPVYTVFIIAALLAIPWFIWTNATWIEVLVSYTIGTSFYEIILEKVIKRFQNK